jgi:hypothetical protein
MMVPYFHAQVDIDIPCTGGLKNLFFYLHIGICSEVYIKSLGKPPNKWEYILCYLAQSPRQNVPVRINQCVLKSLLLSDYLSLGTKGLHTQALLI